MSYDWGVPGQSRAWRRIPPCLGTRGYAGLPTFVGGLTTSLRRDTQSLEPMQGLCLGGLGEGT